jgi:hypothetical protein
MVGNSTMYTGKKINKNNVGIAQRQFLLLARFKRTFRQGYGKKIFTKKFISKSFLFKKYTY